MHLPLPLSLPSFFSLLLIATTASPTPHSSKHNLHLATCTPPPACILIICTPSSPYSLAAFYPNGASTTTTPGETAVVADPAVPWEGVPRQARLRAGALTANITKGAGALKKGELAGEARVGSEGYVCFRDGVGRFVVGGGVGDWGDGERAECVVEYWCAAT